jgi:hypothetical protein
MTYVLLEYHPGTRIFDVKLMAEDEIVFFHDFREHRQALTKFRELMVMNQVCGWMDTHTRAELDIRHQEQRCIQHDCPPSNWIRVEDRSEWVCMACGLVRTDLVRARAR